MQWEQMTRSKFEGGLGFHHLMSFNHALLAKKGWCLLQHPNSLCSHVLKAKYFRRTTFLRTSEGFQPSYLWRSLCKAIPILASGICW